MGDLPGSVDEGVLEELLHALLEVAARKDALRAWPKESPPDAPSLSDGRSASAPSVQARRDEDGTLGVFRFFTIVSDESAASRDPLHELTSDEARARIDGIEDALRPGDEVGVELPLGRLAAIALADVEGTRDGRPHLLPQRIAEMLGGGLSGSALADAVAARLSSLRGPPPHVPLRRLVSEHGDDVVEWTAVCGEVVDPAAESDAAPHGELIVLVSRAGDHRLVVVPTATSAYSHAALLRALAPPPSERSLWRFLEVEGPRLLVGDLSGDVAEGSGALWSEEGPPGENARRLSLELNSITISRDPTVYGVARARARLLTWSGGNIIEDAEALVGLPVDLPRLVSEPWPEGEALARVREAAAEFRARLQQRLSALVDARQPTVADVLGGAAFLRVLARAAAGATLPQKSPGEVEHAAEPTELREVAAPPAAWPEDEIALRVADVGVLALSPADDVVKLRPFPGAASAFGAQDDDAIELFVDGAVVDGDVDAWRAFTDVFAQAVSDAGADVELAFPGESGDEDDVETMMLSAWLLGLAERANRWPPRARAAESAAALQLLVDRFVDVGPGAA